MYTIEADNVKCIVIYATDTDIIVLSIYYYVAYIRELGLKELWIRTQVDSYLPVHKIAIGLGDELCHALPFIHSLSGRDTTSYPFFTGKKSWLKKAKEVELDEIAQFAENEVELDEIAQFATLLTRLGNCS